jgi:hypothetical protein
MRSCRRMQRRIVRGRRHRTGIGSCWRRRWTKFSAGTASVRIAGDASAARAIRIGIVVIIIIIIVIIIVIVVIVKYDWLLCASISRCLVCHGAESMYIPLLPSRWPGRLDCTGMLATLLSGDDVWSVPRTASAEFEGSSVESSKYRARRITLSIGGNSSSSLAAIESSLAWSSCLPAISLPVF